MALLIDLSAYRLVFAHPLDDQIWLLYAAGRMHHGVQLYGPQLIETNPPLIIWFSALPAFLARLLHLSPLGAYQGLACALILLSTTWTIRLLRFNGILHGRVMTALAIILTLAIEASCTNSSDFGQREHLLVLFLLPMFSMRSCMRSRPSEQRKELPSASRVGWPSVSSRNRRSLSSAWESFLCCGIAACGVSGDWSRSS